MDFTTLETPCIPLSFFDGNDASVEEFDPLTLDTINVDVKQEESGHGHEESEFHQEIPQIDQLKQKAIVIVTKIDLRARAKKSSSDVITSKQKKETTGTCTSQVQRSRSSDINVDLTRSKIKDLLSSFCESNSSCKTCDELILKLSQHFSSDHQNQNEDGASPVDNECERESDVDLDLNPKSTPEMITKQKKQKVPLIYTKKTKTKKLRTRKCGLCSKRFRYQVTLDLHLKMTHANESVAFTCTETECRARFRSTRGLSVHFRENHPGQKLQYNCAICSKKFPSMWRLNTHVARVHCSKEKLEKLYPFPCKNEKCDRRFKLKGHLKAHARTCHPPGAKNPFKNKKCVKTYKNPAHAHVTTHDKDKSSMRMRMGMYMCEVFGKCFPKMGKLKIHKMIHTGERPHICDECGRGFVLKNSLNDHYRTHTGERPFKCEVCGKEYFWAGDLKRHMENHHKIV